MKIQAGDTIGKHVTVILNRVDVTADCFEADDREGYADLIVRGENGWPVTVGTGDDLDVKREREHGIVEIVLKRTAPGDVALKFYEMREAS